ncbi:MAG: hypothetical protein J0H11_12905 [Rhizobiales bacterium]|nr:hypothetical protein [Hyphomicrobiales bacterium]
MTASSTSNEPALQRSTDRSPLKILRWFREQQLARQAVFVAGLVALFALVLQRNITFSLNHSRLSTTPSYDDTTYLLDAIRRLNFELANGVGTFVSGFIHGPPHAPVTTLTGMLGFELFGPTPLSAYLANGWILALYIGVMAYVSRPLTTLPARLLFVAAMLFAPVSHAMITEFRPDLAAGLIFAIALVAIVSVDLSRASIGSRIAVAAAAVLATIVKPSAVVIVMPGLGLAFVFSLGLRAWLGGAPFGALLRRALLPILAYIVLMVPFALVWGGQTIAYIYQALVSNADVWRTEGSRYYHWTFHYSGYGGTLALRPFNGLGFALICADICLLLRYRPRAERIAPFALYLTITMLYAAMALSAEKTLFQGSFFYLPYLLAVALAMVRVLVTLRAMLLPSWGADAILACLVAVLAFSRPLGSSYTPVPAFAPQLPALLQSVADRTADFLSRRTVGPGCPDRMPVLSATYPAPLTPESVLFELAVRGHTGMFDSVYLLRTREAIQQTIEGADIVLAPDPSMPGLGQKLPGSAFGGEVLHDLQNDPTWSGLIVGTVDGAPLWLFERSACLPAAAAGQGNTP